VTAASRRRHLRHRRHLRARTPGRLRPIRPLMPFGLSAAVLVGWGLVAHNGGSGWVQFVGETVGATILVGLVGPAFALARERVTVVANAPDATAGEPVTLRVRCRRRVRVRPVDPPGPDGFVGPASAPGAPGAPDALELVPAHHGVLDEVVVDVQSAAPFGIVWWSRRQVLRLVTPLHVAPRVGPAHPLPVAPDRGDGDGAARVPAVVGEPRGARPYRAGDSRRRVHWPASAHSGSLMVRDMEAPARRPARVFVSLPADAEAAERVAEAALGTVLALAARQVPVVLVTTEAGGVVEAAVPHRLGAERRLARAVPGSGPGRDAGTGAGTGAGVVVGVVVGVQAP